jgi:hypothetical protein
VIVNKSRKWWPRFRIVMSYMAWKRATARTSTINRAQPVWPSLSEHYCRGLDKWPRSWMGGRKICRPASQLNCWKGLQCPLLLFEGLLSSKGRQAF